MLKKLDIKSMVSAKTSEIEKEIRENNYKPTLAIIVAGGYSSASTTYVRNKIKQCEGVGIEVKLFDMDWSDKNPEEFKKELSLLIDDLNRDKSITSIIAQLPMPHVNEDEITKMISPNKDVDGFHELSLGALLRGDLSKAPCTPYGINLILKEFNIPVEGKIVTVVGRSNIVGKPMVQSLINQGATVICCNSKTPELHKMTKQADIVVLAVGKAKMFTKRYFKKDAIVIDVAINREFESGKLCGDLDIKNCKDKIGMYTPVPGGVGTTTVLSILLKTLELYKKQHNL